MGEQATNIPVQMPRIPLDLAPPNEINNLGVPYLFIDASSLIVTFYGLWVEAPLNVGL